MSGAYSLRDMYGDAPGFMAPSVDDQAVPEAEDQAAMGGIRENVYLSATQPTNLWVSIGAIMALLFLFGFID